MQTYTPFEVYRNATIAGLRTAFGVALILSILSFVQGVIVKKDKKFGYIINIPLAIILILGMAASIMIPVNRAINSRSPALYAQIIAHENVATHIITEDTSLYLRHTYRTRTFTGSRQVTLFFPDTPFFPNIPVARLAAYTEIITTGSVSFGMVQVAVNENMVGVVRAEHTSLLDR